MKNIIVSILVLFTFYSCLFAQHDVSESTVQKINTLLNEYPVTKGPGIAISVMKEGKIIYKHQKGYANLEHSIPISDTTKFVVGSISKQFTAFAILLLEGKGKLSVDDDITNYLQELKGLTHTITIKQLINHTSGFRNTTDLYTLKGKTEEDRISQEEMVALLLRQKELNFVPGSQFQYCNSGYVLLAEIVKRVSGMAFTEFTQERIFKPLKMTNSLFPDDLTHVIKNKAHSYSKQGNEYRYIPLNRSVVGSTGLYTTTHDLSLWAMNFNDPIIGNRKIFQKMKAKSTLNTGKNIPYALGQEVKKYKGLDVIFHGGGDAGFRSYLLRVPKHEFAVVVTGNFESFNPLNLSYGLVDIFLSDFIKEPKKKQVPDYKHKDLKRFEGDYQVFPGLYITIFAEKDTLYFKGYGSDQKLALPVLDENEFVFPDRPHSKFRFTKDGLVWHFSDFYYPGKKVYLNPPVYSSKEIKAFSGTYKNNEVETSYEFIIKNDQLIATHHDNPDIVLKPIDTDTFISNTAYIGRVEFTRNKMGHINGCKISGQTSYDVFFQRSNTND